MNEKAKNTEIKPINTKLVSFIAGGMSFAYQYKLLQKNDFSKYLKLGICSASFVFCFGVTDYILKNLNYVVK